MAQIHFVGDLVEASTVLPCEALSVSWAIMPGNQSWTLCHGTSFGVTAECQVDLTNTGHFHAPIDVHYASSGLDGWPIFVCEVCLGVSHL